MWTLGPAVTAKSPARVGLTARKAPGERRVSGLGSFLVGTGFPATLGGRTRSFEEVGPMQLLDAQATYTAEDLLRMPEGDRYELVDGRLVELHMGADSSFIGGCLHQL